MAADKGFCGLLLAGILPTSLPFPEIACVRAHEKLSAGVTRACAAQHFLSSFKHLPLTDFLPKHIVEDQTRKKH